MAIGKYFEELAVGSEWITPSRTITEADVVMFAGLTGDYQEIHTSEVVGKNSVFGSRVAHGLLVQSIANGLEKRLGLMEGTGMAFLAIEDWRFLLPVRIGDTIHVLIRLADKRETSKNDRGVTKWDFKVMNQNNQVVETGCFVRMVKRKPQQES